MEKLRSSLHQIQGLLKEYSPLMSGLSMKAVEEAIKYGAVLSTEREGEGDALDQDGVSEGPKRFATKGSEGYYTPPPCSSDTYLTTSI